jgi:hypothetical protein
VRDLVVDAFWELSGWDGRFAATVRALLRKPGLLTVEFLEGRRARYISPLRLYLMASLVYFLAAAAAPNLHPGAVEAGGIRIGLFTGGNPSDTAGRAANPRVTPDAMSAEERKAALEYIAEEPWWIRPVLRRAMLDPGGFQTALFRSLPRMLFALLPVFAGFLAIFYRGRKYPEHLYFAVHLHAFVFLALTASELSKLTRWQPVSVAVGVVAMIWIPIYAHLGLRRVYGESNGRTMAKALGISATYVIASGPALMALVLWAARGS